MDLGESKTYNLALNLDACFPGFPCNQDWVHDFRFCQSDKPTRLDSKIHSQGDRARKEDSGREENCIAGTMIATVLATVPYVPQHYMGKWRHLATAFSSWGKFYNIILSIIGV